MKKLILPLLFIIFSFISCIKEEVDNESFLWIRGISSYDEFGYSISLDHNDWNLNEEFSQKEKQLFDSLDFSKIASAEPVLDYDSSTFKIPRIIFFPNPIKLQGYIYYYNDKHILNLIIVDNRYNKPYSFRLKDSGSFYLDLSELHKGLYRMYYVIQDSQYNIVHLGHGDVEKE